MHVQPLFSSFLVTKQLDLDVKSIQDWCLQTESIDNKVELSLHEEPLQSLYTATQTVFDDITNNILHLSDQVKIHEGWLNKGDSERTSVPHTHPSSTYIGIYYPIIEGDVGRLEFANPVGVQEYVLPLKGINSYNNFNSNVWQVVPYTDLLVVVPSWLQHYVRESDISSTRMSIAINGKVV